MSDAELIERYKLGNEGAFEELLERYKLPLFSYILKMVRNKTVAEDIFQEVWFQIIKLLPRYNEQNKFSALLFKIAYSKVIDYVRKNHRILQHRSERILQRRSEVISRSQSDIEKGIEKEELLSLLNKAAMELPPKQKEVFLLRQHSGLAFKEIAGMLGCPLNTVLARMHNGVLNLRKSLKEVK